jgi:acetyl-CoA carboxylase biotin carboxyl carrier protein
MKEPKADEIRKLIDDFEASDWKTLSLELDDFRLFLSRDPDKLVPGWLNGAQSAAPAAGARPTAAASPLAAPVAPPAAATATEPTAAAPDGAVAVTAPNLGVFYRAPKPGAAPYVNEGDVVEADTEVCLIEVMKLFTPVTAGVSGTVRQVCIEDGEMVEHGQTLFFIQPRD